jgi:hypothetical protein
MATPETPSPGPSGADGPGHPETVPVRPCRLCQVPVPQTRKGTVKDFCCDRHRAAFRTQRVQRAIADAQAALDEAAGELARLAARLDGAQRLLAPFQGSRAKKEKKT